MKRADVLALRRDAADRAGHGGDRRARARAARPDQRMAAADGVLSLSNSLGTAGDHHRARPAAGPVLVGTITLGNTGEAAGTLALARTWLDDAPGPNGGRLSDVVGLLVEDVSGPRPRELLYGEVGGLERMALGAARRGAADLPLHGRVPRLRAARRRQRLRRLRAADGLRVARRAVSPRRGGCRMPTPAATRRCPRRSRVSRRRRRADPPGARRGSRSACRTRR